MVLKLRKIVVVLPSTCFHLKWIVPCQKFVVLWHISKQQIRCNLAKRPKYVATQRVQVANLIFNIGSHFSLILTDWSFGIQPYTGGALSSYCNLNRYLIYLMFLIYFHQTWHNCAPHREQQNILQAHWNKLASLEATLVRNYDPLNHLITDGGKV